jgi:hypothetical protein
MNDVPASIITIGTRLCSDGGIWEVAQITATGVVLRDALGGLRQAGISHLLAGPSTRLLDTAPAEPPPARRDASGLAPPEAEEMRRLAGHVLEVVTGYQRGSEALALPGEPRPQYAPGTAKLQRCEAKAAELGVSVMTVRRMIWPFEAGGPEGLIDQRGQRGKDSLARADPRWLDMARQVLAGHAQASKPTQDLVLAEVAARLDAEHGDGAVPAFEHIIRMKFDDALETMEPEVRLRGPLSWTMGSTAVDARVARPWVAIPARSAQQYGTLDYSEAQGVLVIENLDTFEAICRHSTAPDRWLWSMGPWVRQQQPYRPRQGHRQGDGMLGRPGRPRGQHSRRSPAEIRVPRQPRLHGGRTARRVRVPGTGREAGQSGPGTCRQWTP